MAPPANRELEITYGTLILGGSGSGVSWAQIAGPHLIDKGYDAVGVVFEVLVTGSSAADFATNCSTLETAFRTPRRRLTVKFGASTFLDLNPSDNTGFEQVPLAEKIGDQTSTARSRRYRCSVTAQLPADDSSGRLRVGVTLSYNVARVRQIVITGHYTALTTNDARAQYLATIDAYANSVFTALGLTASAFQVVREDAGPSDIETKNLTFSRVYEEVIYGATSDTLSHASIRQHRIGYAIDVPAPGDTPGKDVRRLQTLVASFEGWVDKSALVGLANIKGLWTSVRTRLLSEVQAKYLPAAIAIVDETYALEPTTNRLIGSMTLRLVPNGAKSIEYERIIEYFDDYGHDLVPVWNGDAYAKHDFQGPARCVRTTIENEMSIGSSFPSPFANDGNPLNEEPAPGGGQWIRMSRHRRSRRLKFGTDEKPVDVLVSQIVTVDECAVKPEGSGGYAAGGTPEFPPGPFQRPGGSISPGTPRAGESSAGRAVITPPSRLFVRSPGGAAGGDPTPVHHA